MAENVRLPVGFVLDEPNKQVNLPKGFVLDSELKTEPKKQMRKFGSYDDPNALMNKLAGITPEQLAQRGHPVASAIQKAGQDLITIPAHFVNQLLLNAPRSALQNLANVEYPETDNPIANPLAKTAGVIGGFKNPLIKYASQAPNLAQLALRSGVAGAAYTPTDDMIGLKQRAISGGVSAALPLAGKGISNVVSKIPNARNMVSARIINSLIKPLKKDFSYGKNPGLAVAQEGIVANNLDDLAVKISSKKSELGTKIQNTLSSSKEMIDISDAVSPIDDAIALAKRTPKTKAAVIKRLQDTKDDIVGLFGSGKVSPKQATSIKGEIGDLTQWTGNPSDDKAVNKALKMVYGKVRSKIEGVVPSIKPLNERYANLITAESATKYRNAIMQRQNMIGFGAGQAGLTSGLITAIATGGQAVPSILTGVGVTGLAQAAKSPAVKTRLASWLSTATPQQKATLFNKIPQLKQAILSGEIGLPSRIVDSLSAN